MNRRSRAGLLQIEARRSRERNSKNHAWLGSIHRSYKYGTVARAVQALGDVYSTLMLMRTPSYHLLLLSLTISSSPTSIRRFAASTIWGSELHFAASYLLLLIYESQPTSAYFAQVASLSGLPPETKTICLQSSICFFLVLTTYTTAQERPQSDPLKQNYSFSTDTERRWLPCASCHKITGEGHAMKIE